jgi:hypothetical protein
MPPVRLLTGQERFQQPDFCIFRIKTSSGSGKNTFFFQKKVDFVCVGDTVTYP